MTAAELKGRVRARKLDLPDNARRYVARIQALVDVQAAFISVGPGRDEIIKVSDPFDAA